MIGLTNAGLAIGSARGTMADTLDRYFGTWELDPSTLNYEHGRPGRRAVYTIEPADEGLRFTLDADDADGKPMFVKYGGKLDGVDYAYAGYPVTVSLAMLEDGSIESVAKRDGVVVDRWTRTLIGEGRAMLICQHGADPDGKPWVNSGLYRRVS